MDTGQNYATVEAGSVVVVQRMVLDVLTFLNRGRILLIILICVFYFLQGYEGSLLKVTSKNGKTASVSVLLADTLQ
jgi:hypothetical protein